MGPELPLVRLNPHASSDATAAASTRWTLALAASIDGGRPL